MTAGTKQTGTTFVELLISIIIVSVALTGILLAFSQNATRSADPLIQHQSIAIAESYLEEILAKSFTDPDGIPEGANRSQFDDVSDYNALPDTLVRDQNNVIISGLENYSVSVTVTANSIGPVGSPVAAGNAMLISVTVTPTTGNVITLSGYKVNYL